jgi:outer membrane protein assembly factor BamA
MTRDSFALSSRVRRAAHAWLRGAWTLGLACSVLACNSLPQGRSAVDSVSIENLHVASAEDLEERLATAKSPKFLGLMQGVVYEYSVLDESRLQRDLARVERYLRGHGFLDARARAGRVQQVSKDHVRVTIIVEEGVPTMNGRTTWKGLDALPKPIQDKVTDAATKALPPNARFDETSFNKAEVEVKRALTDNGYAFAKVSSDGQLDLGAHVADYAFTLDPGPAATFGAITLEGLDPDGAGPQPQEIPDNAVLRAINIQPGTPYSTAQIESATTTLLDLGVFSSAEIVPALPDPPPANPVVPLTVKLEPTRLRQWRFGGGAEFDLIKTELHLLMGWENHNFLGGLRSFSFEWKPGVVLYPVRVNNLVQPTVGILEQRFRAELRQPGFIEARTTGFIRPELNVFPLLVVPNPPADFPVVSYLEPKVTMGVDRTFLKRLFVSLGYTVQVEDPFQYPGTPPADAHASLIELAYPELITRLDFRDSAIHPHAGVFLGNSFQVAGLGSSAKDLRVQPEVRTYLPLGKRVTFATRASVGFLFAFDYAKDWYFSDLERSPFIPKGATTELAALQTDIETMYFRGFFSGGPSTNRGFPLRAIAPSGVVPFLSPATAGAQLAAGSGANCVPGTPGFSPTNCYIPVGGFSLWELSNEVRFQVAGPFALATFCDMGDVSPFVADLRFSHLHLSCGAGARYDTPVGPIRVDVGYRVQPLQVLGCKNEVDAATFGKCPQGDPVNGTPQTILGAPIAISIGIGEAF